MARAVRLQGVGAGSIPRVSAALTNLGVAIRLGLGSKVTGVRNLSGRPWAAF